MKVFTHFGAFRAEGNLGGWLLPGRAALTGKPQTGIIALNTPQLELRTSGTVASGQRSALRDSEAPLFGQQLVWELLAVARSA